MKRLAVVLLLLSGCVAPALDAADHRDSIQIADSPWTFGAPRHAGGFGRHDIAIRQFLEELGLTAGGSPTFGTVTATDVQTATISAADGTLAATITDATGVVAFDAAISGPEAQMGIFNMIGWWLGLSGSAGGIEFGSGHQIVWDSLSGTNVGGLSGDLWIGVEAAGTLRIGDTSGSSDGTLSLAALGARAATTDVATTDLVVTAMDAWAQATGGNLVGSDLVLAGGIGGRNVTVVDYTLGAGNTVTVTVNGSATVLTEGVDFDAVTSNNATADEINVALSGVSGFSLTTVGAVVYVQPDPGTYSLTLATDDVTAWTVTNSADGQILIPDGTGSSPGLAFAGDPDTGIVSPAANNLDIRVGGILAARFSSASSQTLTKWLAPDGSAAAPTFAYTSDTDAGHFSTATDGVGTATAGVVRLAVEGGSILLAGTDNAASVSVHSNSEEITGIAAASVTTSSLVPAGARLLYVVGRVTTTISGGGVTDADWGDGTDVNRYNEGGTTAQLTAGDTVDSTDYTADSESWSAATQDVTVTFQGGTPTAGAIRFTAFYTLPTAPGS